MATVNILGGLFNNKLLGDFAPSLLISLHKQGDERFAYLMRNWDFYEGRQAGYFRRMEAEDNTRFRERQNKAFVDNFCRAVVDKSVSYLYGQGQKIVRRFTDPKVSEFMAKNYEFNDVNSFMINLSTMAGVEGNA